MAEKQKLIFTVRTLIISGPDSGQPCVFPFIDFGVENDKCLDKRFGVVGSVKVSKYICCKM